MMTETGFLDKEWTTVKIRRYPSGVLHMLIGPSGAGKSTYAQVLMRAERLTVFFK